MKSSKSNIHSKVHKIPEIKSNNSKLTSFAGAIIFWNYFIKTKFRAKLRSVGSHINDKSVYKITKKIEVLLFLILFGYRYIAGIKHLKNDPLFKRCVGLNKIPDASSITRALSSIDNRTCKNYRKLSRDIVLSRIVNENFKRVTLDFDGSVNSTKSRTTEGTAIGFNKQKKGCRSYYPLYCTVAQTGQVLEHLHRPGNVHDSNKSYSFMKYNIMKIKQELPNAIIESRKDSAFFSEKTVNLLNSEGVEYSISVPVNKFSILKKLMMGKRKWIRINSKWDYAEVNWKPKSWQKDTDCRMIAYRQKVHRQHKGPIQLDLFIPYDEHYEYKAICTSMNDSAKKVLEFHNGRGTQEKIFGELKNDLNMDRIPMRTLNANRIYLTSTIIAYNINREIQIEAARKPRKNTLKRKPLWKFISMRTFRENFIQRAGRLIYPQGKLTLEMNESKDTIKIIKNFLNIFPKAA